MKRAIIFLITLLLANAGNLFAQEAAALTVKYVVSYDAGQKLYTAWVVPDYDTPNASNPNPEEKGATA